MSRKTFGVVLAGAASFSLCAQESVDLPNFRVDLTLGAGSATHNTDKSNLDGDTAAGYFRIEFEGFSDRGFGGGLRLEGWKSDDDLFDDNGFQGYEATTSSLFAHASWRFTDGNLCMPVRAGLLFHGHRIEDTTTGEQTTFSSFGPQFEVAPELFLTQSKHTKWSLFAELGLGAGYTSVEVDGVSGEFDSSTWFYGIELGTRVYLGPVELGLSYVARGHMMAESDPENSTVVFGYEAGFDGLALTMGVVF
jgi:hypothetical protein